MTTNHKLQLLDSRNLVTHEEISLVPVYYADTRPEAARCCAMLELADIPACVGDDAEEANGEHRERDDGCFVLVPESFQNQASELIASRCAASDIDDEDDLVDDDEDDPDEDLLDDSCDDDFDDDDLEDDWDD